MNVKFRVFHNSEMADLRSLMGQLGYSHSTESLSETVIAIRKNGGEIFVAEYNKVVIGCASAIIDIRLASGISGEIVSVVVDQTMRGKGVGKGLIETAETWLVGKVSSIRIRANSLRTEAPKFYKALGYSLSKNQSVFAKLL